MNKTKTIFLLILLGFQFSFAQKPSSTVKLDSLNTNLLEQLIKDKIDSVRKVKRVKPLIICDTLVKAAEDQSKYLKKIKKLTHFQNENAKKKTVADRVAFYGLKNTSVAENVANTYVLIILKNKNGKEYQNTTYNDVASDFTNLWVNSPGHYTNLINPEYSLTGVAVSFNKSTNKIYAVQVFSTKTDVNIEK